MQPSEMPLFDRLRLIVPMDGVAQPLTERAVSVLQRQANYEKEPDAVALLSLLNVLSLTCLQYAQDIAQLQKGPPAADSADVQQELAVQQAVTEDMVKLHDREATWWKAYWTSLPEAIRVVEHLAGSAFDAPRAAVSFARGVADDTVKLGGPINEE